MPNRVLIVEDDCLVAMALADVIQSSGFVPVGPARTAVDALKLANSSACDVAVLDFRLVDGTSEPVAIRLAEQGIPFVVASANAKLPPAFDGAPIVPKPTNGRDLVRALRECLQQADRSHARL